MKHKSLLLLLAPIPLLGFICIGNINTIHFTFASKNSYSITLNKDNAIASEEYTSTTKTTLTNEEKNDVSFTYSDVKGSANNHCQINEGGYIANFSEINGLTSITATYSGSLKLYYGIAKSCVNEALISTGAEVTLSKDAKYFKLAATSETILTSVELKYTCIRSDSIHEVRLYEADFENYKSYEYQAGQTVDISKWEIPYKEFEGEPVPFKNWMDETLKNEITSNFEMPNKSLAFYPTFTEPQKFRWTYDKDTNTYTSTGSGYRPITQIQATKYGRLTYKITLPAGFAGTVGAVWHLIPATGDYPGISAGDYMYSHFNTSVGTTQLASNINNSYTGRDYLNLANLGATHALYLKWKNWSDAGRKEAISFYQTIDIMPHSTASYLDGVRTLMCTTYVDDLNSTMVGIRASAAGVICSDFEFLSYNVEAGQRKNGFDILANDFYICNPATKTNKVAVTYDTQKSNTKHARITATVTTMNRNNNCVGIFNGASLASGAGDVLVSNAANNGYYYYHNVTYNGNLTMTTYTNGTYAKHPDSSSGNIVTYTYAENGKLNTAGQSHPSIVSYFERNNKWQAFETNYISMTMCFEIASDSMSIYLDGELIYQYTDTKLQNLYGDNCINPGFCSYVPGALFSNISYEVLA